MEVLLFALFFIASLLFFILGKDDFGRKEERLMTRDPGKEDFKKEVIIEQKEEAKKEVELEST